MLATAPVGKALQARCRCWCCWARNAGPRFGSFIKLYGFNNTQALIAKALKGSWREVMGVTSCD